MAPINLAPARIRVEHREKLGAGSRLDESRDGERIGAGE